MRVMGPLALHYYFPEQVDLYARLERLGERYFTDIDFVADGKSGGKIKGLMEKLGYECDVNTLMMTGKTRQIYYGGAVPMIDVFLDKLDYCHEVELQEPPGVRRLLHLAHRHRPAEAPDLGDQRQGPQGPRVPHDRRRHRRRRGQEDQPLATSPSGSPTTGASGTRPPPTWAGSRPTWTAWPAFDDAQKAHIKQRCDECWPASRPSPRPRTGRSGPRRAPTRSGTTRTSATGRAEGSAPPQRRPARTRRPQNLTRRGRRRSATLRGRHLWCAAPRAPSPPASPR